MKPEEESYLYHLNEAGLRQALLFIFRAQSDELTLDAISHLRAMAHEWGLMYPRGY